MPQTGAALDWLIADALTCTEVKYTIPLDCIDHPEGQEDDNIH